METLENVIKKRLFPVNKNQNNILLSTTPQKKREIIQKKYSDRFNKVETIKYT